MHKLIFLVALFLGATSCKAGPDAGFVVANDRDYLWAVSSGLKGQRDAVALPLYTAVIEQDRGKAQELLERGASPNLLLSRDRWSVLMIASAEGDVDLVKLLVAHGANLNFTRCDPIAFSPLAVALSYAVPRQDFTTFDSLLAAGADVNATCTDTGDSVERDGNGDAFTGDDIAQFAATLGQMEIVNRMLARGYRRDLSELLIRLKIRQVDEQTQPEKGKAIAMVMALLADPSYRRIIPNLLADLRKLIANEQVAPWDEKSAFKDPEKDPEVIQLERILKAGKT